MGNDICIIWNTPCLSSQYIQGVQLVQRSTRAGGNYKILSYLDSYARDLSESEKARLTSWPVEQRMAGNEYPQITESEIENAKSRKRMTVHQRADRLLRRLVDKSIRIGEILQIYSSDNPRANLDLYYSELAWSESISQSELFFLMEYLKKQERITIHNYISDSKYQCRVEIPGYSRIEELATNPDSTQSFVAMWFDDRMNEVYEKAIEPAIKDAGYKPVRMDRKTDLIDKIDDAIIAEIRRSRFLVADFTHGDTGARGGVYYEAGFARGLGIPVVFMCRNDKIEEVHFDTRQFNHILWRDGDFEDVRKTLADRIVASIGEGPVS